MVSVTATVTPALVRVRVITSPGVGEGGRREVRPTLTWVWPHDVNTDPGELRRLDISGTSQM